VVKIKLKSIFVAIVMFAVLVGTVFAAGDKLVFSDVDVKVGGKIDRNLVDGEKINEEARPGEIVEFRVEVLNNFTRQGLEIQDITIEVTIEEIDDGDDLEDESKEFDLSATRDHRETIRFQVPIEVEERDYFVRIRAEGDDLNGTTHVAEMSLILEVEKEAHLLDIVRASVSPSVISCNRRNVQLAVTVLNMGTEDESDVQIDITSSALGVGITDFLENELTAEPNEPEARYSKVYTFNVDSNIEPGTYPINVRVLYNNDNKLVEKVINLDVLACSPGQVPVTPPKVPVDDKKEEKDDSTVVLITPNVIDDGKKPDSTQQEIPVTATTESIFSNNAFLLTIVIAEVFAVVVGIIIIASLFFKREE
jgi:hypothetical protein